MGSIQESRQIAFLKIGSVWVAKTVRAVALPNECPAIARFEKSRRDYKFSNFQKNWLFSNCQNLRWTWNRSFQATSWPMAMFESSNSPLFRVCASSCVFMISAALYKTWQENGKVNKQKIPKNLINLRVPDSEINKFDTHFRIFVVNLFRFAIFDLFAVGPAGGEVAKKKWINLKFTKNASTHHVPVLADHDYVPLPGHWSGSDIVDPPGRRESVREYDYLVFLLLVAAKWQVYNGKSPGCKIMPQSQTWLARARPSAHECCLQSLWKELSSLIYTVWCAQQSHKDIHPCRAISCPCQPDKMAILPKNGNIKKNKSQTANLGLCGIKYSHEKGRNFRLIFKLGFR